MVLDASKALDEVFDKFLQNKDKIFKNREILSHNYVPNKLFHREKQYNIIFNGMVQSYKQKNSFIFCYGGAGTGKTSLIASLINKIRIKCEEIDTDAIITTIINCRQTTTSYRILLNLMSKIGISKTSRYNFNKLFQRFMSKLESKNHFIVLILDEIDKIIGKGTKKATNIMNFFNAMNERLKNTRFCIIGISNDLKFKNHISKNFLSEMNVIKCEFQPYNAIELKNIIDERADEGFCTGVIKDGVLGLIAAFGAQMDGDARHALCLLSKAGELAERKGEKSIKEEHVRIVQKFLQK